MEFLIRQLLKSMGIIVRTVRVFFTRRVAGIFTKFRQLTNVSRGAVKVANTALQSATNVAKTPSKREDYIAFGNLLIAKSLLARAAIGVGALCLLVYFILWPWFLAHFLTARFWVEDKRVPDWTGRVIVFADKRKTVRMYAGRLEHGVLQGEGQEYDENGVLSYEGTFADGRRSGMGNAYTDGVLCYEGQFSQGLYEGTGITYIGGKTAYEGQFSAGKYQGRGTLYQGDTLLYDGQFDQGVYQGQGSLYQAGTLEYQGAFQAGVPEGMGTSYYYGGGVKYEGQFVKGVPEGTGKAYEDGRMVYQGSFAQGTYNGGGTLYPVPGEQIQGTFVDGAPDGVVRWSKGGKLYYEGEWAEDRPEGYGVLYAKSGEAAYQGTFSLGTIDGSRLLGMGVDDLRKALGESVSTAGRGSTFAVSSPGLGLTAQCTYQTDSADSHVAAVYLYAPEDGDGWFRLLPGMDRAVLPTENIQRGSLTYTRQDAVPLAAGDYGSTQAVTEAGIETIVYQRQVPVLVRWTASPGAGFTASSGAGADAGTGAGPGAGAGGASADALAAGVTGMDAVEELLSSLDGMEEAPAAEEPAYGDAPVGDAIAACETLDAASALVSALSDYWYQAETERLLAENLSRTQALLEDARKQSAMGQGNPGALEALDGAAKALEARIVNCELEKKQAEVAAQSAGGADPAGMDLSQTAVLFDPSQLDANELPVVAAAYAQAMGEAADPAELSASVKSALLRLQESYAAVQSSIRQYEAAAQAGDSAAREYAMGTGSKAAWYDALSAKNDVRAALYGSMNAFTKQAAELNSVTGGWVSRSTGWHAEEMDAVTSAQFPDGLPTEPDATGPDAGETDGVIPDTGTQTGGETDSPTGTGTAGTGTAGTGTAGTGTAGTGTAGTGTAGTGTAGTGTAGTGTAGTGTAGTGTAGTGTAGTETAGTGTAGTGTAGTGTAGTGTAGTGTAGTGTAGTGTAGTGTAGTGTAGTETAGTGTAGTGTAGTGTAGTETGGTGTGTTGTGGSAAGGNSGQPSDKGDSPYPDWYDPEKEPSENEPGLPREQEEEPADAETTETETAGNGTAGNGTAGNGTAGTGASSGDASSLGGAEIVLTPEEWDAVWGIPEG